MKNQKQLIGSSSQTAELKQALKGDRITGDYQQLLQQMLLKLGGHFNECGDLKLLNNFAPELNPNSEFFTILAQIVQLAFPAGLASGTAETEQLRKMVHQLRYYLDVINVQYLRRKYPKAKNDWQRLIYYDLDCQLANHTISKAEPARLHNKIDLSLNIPVTPGWNIKRVYGFHVEFILNQNRDFMVLDVVNINYLQLGNIINCSSFNYANQNDQIHQKLDVHYDAPSTPLFTAKDPWWRALLTSYTRSPAKGSQINAVRELKRQVSFDIERKVALIFKRTYKKKFGD
ncbi:DUF3114 domain-containing protein [Paucilactobacillus wasatchensis]|uniref:Uncharacterized protein n=1 Tax=Paucilactobacillus wasatchensis TaxID=1335616 RepID=A0A0D0Y4U4_9LACO|nr:DUF3114 domain-containing protein [Paucilactobacillus wasatchensis]KIS03308.1 hypothetical protein WDC_1065 [Paucilactobacillus wasatchensis]